MIKVSTKTTYAIRAMVQLGREPQGTSISLPAISQKQGIPLPYLEQIFSKLRKAGLVEAVRGPQGGYKLAKQPQEISLANIISVLDGPVGPVLCTMPENRTPDCHEVEGCLSRLLCCEIDGALNKVLTQNTLNTFLTKGAA
jgi:Rrf2 family transcriptional regulator, cysteine metabolism repressor